MACAEVKTIEACDARDDCHTVLADTSLCSCVAAGCCAIFDFCADGALADCKGPATCKRMEPTCTPDFVVAFKYSCYEGCVRPIDCAP